MTNCTICGSDRTTGEGSQRGKKRGHCKAHGGYFTAKQDLTYDDREFTDFSLKDYWDKAKADQVFNRKLNYRQRSLHAKIKTDRPIILQFIADMQFGGDEVDYELFEKYTDYIVNTPDLYLAILGDELDTFFTSFYTARPVHTQIFSPEQQQMFFEKWLQEIEHKLIFSTWDNHADMRYEKMLGWSPAAMLRAKYAPYFDGHAQVYLKVGKTEYKICAAHHFKAKSKFNPLHGSMSFAREQVQDADIYAGADQHQASIGHFALGGKDRIYLMTGTLQSQDDYTNRFITPFSQKQMPSIVLHPNEKKMVGFRTMEDGGTYLKGCK